MRLPLLLLSAILLLPAAVLADTQLPAREIRILGTEPLDRLEIAAFTDELVPVKKWRGEADLVLSGGEVVPLTGVARQKRSGLNYKLKTAKRAAVR